MYCVYTIHLHTLDPVQRPCIILIVNKRQTIKQTLKCPDPLQKTSTRNHFLQKPIISLGCMTEQDDNTGQQIAVNPQHVCQLLII